MGRYRVEKSMEINAPAEKIWDQLIDLHKWPEWKSFIKDTWSKDDALSMGTRFKMKIAVKGLAPTLSATICDFNPPKSLVWAGGAKGIMSAEHGFTLDEKDGKTVVTSWEEFSGVLVGLILLVLGKKTLDKLHENWVNAIKERVE